jgi:hypothetical protein
MGALLAAGLVATLLAQSVAATTPVPRRTWQTTLKGGGATGAAVLVVNTNWSGTISIGLQGLKPNSKYAAMIYKGTCASPTALVRLPTIVTDATGIGQGVTGLSGTQGVMLWTAGSKSKIAVRVGTGIAARCGVLTYPVATRIAIAKYRIDLPIVLLPGTGYPYCNVAMYLTALSQPGERGPTFIFAHARTGMFLPLLTASKVNNGAAMVGMIVKVWRSDNRLYTYKVTRVMRSVYTLPSYNANSELLWLQTSEGPHGTAHKLMIEAKRISVTPATYAASHPTPHVVKCGT